MTGLRVATYNLYLGADLSLLFGVTDLDELAKQVRVVREQLEATRFDERARAVAAVLGRERPDLVGLQEVSRWTLTAAGRRGAGAGGLPPHAARRARERRLRATTRTR